MIRFEIIDGGNWRTKIETKPEQVHYVANCTTILARAYAYREERSRAYLIFNDALKRAFDLRRTKIFTTR